MNDDDVPTPIDFHDPEHARQWVVDTAQRRPFRPRFFAAFCAALPQHAIDVLELGSGPGQLAREILTHCNVRSYSALDFSAAMHALAGEHLGALAQRVTFVMRDFRDPAWTLGLGPFDAIVTMQAAHETRHKRHLVPFLARARTVLAPTGVLLYCDHFAGGTANPALVVERDEQPAALHAAGFATVSRLYEEGGMALYSAQP